MERSRSPFPRWVTWADVSSVVLVVLALLVLATGGVRGYVGGILVSVTDETRLLLAAAVIIGVRHLRFRGESLPRRLVHACNRGPGRRLFAWMATVPPLPRDEALFLKRQPGGSPVGAVEFAVVAAAMVLLTVVMTYPQVNQLESVRDLGDPIFSTWRLAWIAHQLPRDPLHLFDANIFFPEPGTLAYSDSVLLPGTLAAPLIRLGVKPIVVYNLWILASFVLAGVCMYLFVRSITGQAPAAGVAAVAFAFHPFRFDHYSHFELLFSFWMPLALWALHRALESGRRRDALLAGGAVAGQCLSSMYFGIFLATYLVPVAVTLALGWGRARERLRPLAAGIVLTAVLVVPVVVPYLQVQRALGERAPEEIAFYSAQPYHYLYPHYLRTTWAGVIGLAPHEPEKDLFPGVLIVVLAGIAVWPPLSAARIAYVIGLLLAFEASLGFHGVTYWLLHRWFFPFHGLRVPARFSMLVGLSLAVLAGYGVARLTSRLRRAPARYVVAAAICAVLLFESRSLLVPVPVWPQVQPVYQWFEGRPPAAIAELPTPPLTELWRECRFMYASTVHWQRLLNGYSGTFPPSYRAFNEAMATFPDDASVRLLRAQGAEYVVIHEELYGRQRYQQVVDVLDQRPEFQAVSRVVSDGHEARIYRLVRSR